MKGRLMNSLMSFGICLALAGLLHAGEAVGAAPGPIVLQNDAIALQFDGQTGAWTGFIDRSTGDNLLTAPLADSMMAGLCQS
jgi:hypothetical protein